MTVKPFDTFKHWGNKKEYEFLGVALPAQLKPDGFREGIHAFHTEDSESIPLSHKDGIYFSYKEEYLVLYKDAVGVLFARPMQNFFEHVDGKTRRFTKTN